MDTKTPLKQLEAARLITLLEDNYGKKIKYRQAIGFTPEQVGARIGVRPIEIAKMAGREKENGKAGQHE